VKLLRQQVGDSAFLSWVPFIHLGLWGFLEVFLKWRCLRNIVFSVLFCSQPSTPNYVI
jgi:hypothetical protein